MGGLSSLGVHMDDVGLSLEEQAIEGFHESFTDVLFALGDEAARLTRR